jgi:transglutaminase-like putative cysteine protease
MRFSISHEFRYTYESPVRLSTQYLRLMPRDTLRQKVLAWDLETPGAALRTTDGYGNVLHVLTIDKPVTEIAIVAAGAVDTLATRDEPSDFTGAPLPPLVFLRPTALTRADDELVRFADKFRNLGETLPMLRGLAQTVRRRDPTGSAADAVHVFIACCRHLRVPARYVSGYFYAAGVAMHAWAEAWVNERWHSFDITRDEPVGETHIKIAVGADYLDACPVRGVRVGGGQETLIAQAHVEASQQ